MYQRTLGDDATFDITPLTVATDYGVAYDGVSSDVSPPAPSGSSFLDTLLTDVTQFFKPGTPSVHPLYTPASTALGQNLLPIAAVGVVAFLLLSRKR